MKLAPLGVSSYAIQFLEIQLFVYYQTYVMTFARSSVVF